MHTKKNNLTITDAFTAKTVEVDSLRFNNRDLEVIGTLEYGQFGVVELWLSVGQKYVTDYSLDEDRIGNLPLE